MGKKFGRSLLNVATLGLFGAEESDDGLSEAIQRQTIALEQAINKQMAAQKEAQEKAEKATAEANEKAEQAQNRADKATAQAQADITESQNSADITQGQAVKENVKTHKPQLGGSVHLGTTDEKEEEEDWYAL